MVMAFSQGRGGRAGGNQAGEAIQGWDGAFEDDDGLLEVAALDAGGRFLDLGFLKAWFEADLATFHLVPDVLVVKLLEEIDAAPRQLFNEIVRLPILRRDPDRDLDGLGNLDLFAHGSSLAVRLAG